MESCNFAPRQAARARRAGFTLMELMAVVGIIVVMASMVVGGFAGIQHAMGTSSGADRFRRALNAARQQACVDGTDVFVWCTDVDKFVVCRKGGTVCGPATAKASREIPYSGTGKVEAWWVCDEFAERDEDFSRAFIDDLADSGDKDEIGRIGIPGGGEAIVKGGDIAQFFARQFSDFLVFDVTARKLGKCAYPPFHVASREYEGWMFGIRDEDYDRKSFTTGHDYAWPLMPVQTLPGGFVFDGSWNKSSGDLDENWVKDAYVQFYPDGRAKCGISSGFSIIEVGAANPSVQRIKIDGNGLVTVTSKK